MKIKNMTHIVLALLFLFAYQVNTVHSSQHFLEELGCTLCEASPQLDAKTHESSVPVHVDLTSLELTSLEVTKVEQVVNRKKPIAKQLPLVRRADFTSLQTFVVSPIPLGYYSHAPPHTFS
ncbi:MAG TPA: hypothetical protein EYH42_10015 [Sulfurovum sp.]|nr:hypothetical protein [Sulfurovum sp.]